MPRKLLASFVVFLALGACAQPRFYPPDPETRAQLDGIAVVAEGRAPSPVRPDRPVEGAGEGAASGAGQGALGSVMGGAYAGASSGDPLGFVVLTALGIVLAPPAAVIGGVVGASRAHSADEVQAADEALRAGLADVALLDRLHARVTESLRARTPLRVVALRPAERPDFASLAVRGVASVLEIGVTRFDMTADGEISPDITIHFDVEARLLRASDGQELYRRAWAYRSREHNYFDLAEDDAALLRAQIATAERVMAEKIVYDLFVATTPEAATIAPETAWTTSAAPQPDAARLGRQGPSDSATAWRQDASLGRPCTAGEDPAHPWVGSWAAASGQFRLELEIDAQKVRGRLTSTGDTFPVLGTVDERGVVDAAIYGKYAWDTAQVRGAFPVVKITQTLGGQRSPVFRQLDGRSVTLCG